MRKVQNGLMDKIKWSIPYILKILFKNINSVFGNVSHNFFQKGASKSLNRNYLWLIKLKLGKIQISRNSIRWMIAFNNFDNK